MNIEIANKLLELRKEKGFSQEQLAEQLGISRQAISKWERAEASPDTDNLIELARLYGISLDDLLLHTPTAMPKEEETETKQKGDFVHVGFDGVHVVDDNGDEVHVTWKGIKVKDSSRDIKIDKDGIVTDGERVECGRFFKTSAFPIGIVLVTAILLYMFIFQQYMIGAILLMTIPVVSSLFLAIKKRKMTLFAYPVFITMIYLYLGFSDRSLWGKAWVVFVTIPAYYALAQYFDNLGEK